MSLATVSVGTMNFGSRTPSAEAQRIVHRSLERGATFFDTANVYGEGESERILGAALEGHRAQAQIATKVGLWKREGLSRTRVLAAIDESLKRLRTDCVDVYYLHAPDPSTPIAETLEALQTLLSSGKIRAWGVSNYASWQIGEINTLCAALGMPGPVMSQVLYNLLVRQLDIEYFRFTRAHPLHTTVYNPLAGGLLARSPQVGASIPAGSRFATNPMYPGRYWNDALLELAGQFRDLATTHGMDLVTLAYAWVAGQPGVQSVLCGPGSVQHLDAALTACAVVLSPEVRTRVDEISRAFLGTDATYAR